MELEMVKVKICGITDYQVASVAADLGVNALGFIFASSPRQVTPEEARGIIRSIPPFIKTVGVFVNERPDKIKEIVEFCGLDLIQLHGDEPPDLCNELMPFSIKALRIKDKSSIKFVEAYRGSVRALVLDTYSTEKMGGIGKSFDWGLAVETKRVGIPLILAGGLDPMNIKKAITTVRPYAVDVNSGVEESPGKKSVILLRALMENARGIKPQTDCGEGLYD